MELGLDDALRLESKPEYAMIQVFHADVRDNVEWGRLSRDDIIAALERARASFARRVAA